jgi:hypothetical protein
MTVLPNLERLLGDAAERLAPTSIQPAAATRPTGTRSSQRRVRRQRLRRWRPLALVTVLVLGGATGALAAAGVFQTGTPIGAQPGYAPISSVGFGAPKHGSMRVLTLRVADPAGGLPWGLGLFTTTQGLACPVTGRVIDGRLGALGIDYVFGDDGRFHLLLAPAGISIDCSPVDAHGHAFLTGGYGWIQNASGDTAPAAAVNQRPHCDLPGEHDWGVRCPQADLRAVFYGFLGPDARMVFYSFNGVRHLERVSGPDGGYLIVLPAPPGSTVGRAANLGDVKPPTAVYVTYTNGRTCTLASADLLERAPGPCTAVGYVQGPLELPTREAVSTPVHVTYHAALPVGILGPRPALAITFTARVAITTTQDGYAVEARRPNTHACTRALARSDRFIPLEDNTQRTIAAGQTVRLVLPLQPLCAGRYSGRVYYGRGPRFAGVPGQNFLGRDQRATVTVADFAINVP